MDKNLPRATHEANLEIGNVSIPCAVLEDGTRVLRERSVATSLGSKGGGAYWQRKKSEQKGALLPEYVSKKNLEPFISDEVRAKLLTPITYITKTGSKARGISATLLPEICNIWLEARGKGALTKVQKKAAKNAEILMRGLAYVGIIALVDEATGYQEERDRYELNKILQLYIAKELLPWTKRFPDEFYKELFRLRGWRYSPIAVKRPKYVGKLTNELIYDKLPHGVLEELQKKNPTVAPGQRRYRHHQFLTDNIGHPHLGKHIASVVTLMRVSSNWRQFERHFRRAFPTLGDQMFLEMEYPEDEISR